MHSRLKPFAQLELFVCRALLCLLSRRLSLREEAFFAIPGNSSWLGLGVLSGDLDSDLETLFTIVGDTTRPGYCIGPSTFDLDLAVLTFSDSRSYHNLVTQDPRAPRRYSSFVFVFYFTM